MPIAGFPKPTNGGRAVAPHVVALHAASKAFVHQMPSLCVVRNINPIGRFSDPTGLQNAEIAMKTLLLLTLLALAACHPSDDANNSSNAAEDAPANSTEVRASEENVDDINNYQEEANSDANAAMDQMGANVGAGANAGSAGGMGGN